MPRKSEFDTRRLNLILQEQHSVISRAQVFSCGMSRSALHLRIASPGPWQRILPGVYLAATGGTTQHQREMAALVYARPARLITGPAAERRDGLRSPRRGVGELLM